MAVTIQVPKWAVALVLYLFAAMAVLLVRPALLFDSAGYPKSFALGLSEGNSVLAPCAAFPLLALLSYFVAGVAHVVIM